MALEVCNMTASKLNNTNAPTDMPYSLMYSFGMKERLVRRDVSHDGLPRSPR